MSNLTPPDKNRCQGEFLAGSFMTLGPRHWERCKNPPTVLVTETFPGPDGQHGSMSLCDDCKLELVKKMGHDYFTETRLPLDPVGPGGMVVEPDTTPRHRTRGGVGAVGRKMRRGK